MWGFANSYLEAFPELRTGEHRAVAHLPMAHLIERSMSICLPLVAEVIPHIGEEVEDLLGTLYEVQPTFLNVVPRVLEKMASQVIVGLGAVGGSSGASTTGVWQSARVIAEPAGPGKIPAPLLRYSTP